MIGEVRCGGENGVTVVAGFARGPYVEPVASRDSDRTGMCVKYAAQTTQKRQFLNLFCASLLPHLYMVSSCVYPHDAGLGSRIRFLSKTLRGYCGDTLVIIY